MYIPRYFSYFRMQLFIK